MNKADDVMKFDSFVIFGGCGFIGSHVVDLLREKYPDAKIYIADLLADTAQSDGVISYQRVDVRSQNKL